MDQRQFFLNCFTCIEEGAGRLKSLLATSLWTRGSSSWAFALEFPGAGGQTACPWSPRWSAALASHSRPRVFPIIDCISHHHVTLNLYEKLGETLDFSLLHYQMKYWPWSEPFQMQENSQGASLGLWPKTLGFPARPAEQMWEGSWVSLALSPQIHPFSSCSNASKIGLSFLKHWLLPQNFGGVSPLIW